MKRNYFSMVIALVLGIAPLSFGQAKRAGVWMGKTGHLTIKAPIMVGNSMLPAGDYEVKQFSQPEQCVVEFTQLIEVPDPAFSVRRPPQATPVYAREKVAEVSCTPARLNAKARKTVAASENARLTKLEIKGDGQASLF